MDGQILLTVAEASKRLRLGRSHTYKFILSGELRSLKLGHARRVPVQALDEFVERLIGEQDSSQP